MDLQALFDRRGVHDNKKLIDGSESLTYGTFYQKCSQMNAFLQENEFVPGDRIGIATTDEIESCFLVLCCIRLGLPVALIDPASKKTEAMPILNKLNLKGMFLDHTLASDWTPDVGRMWTLKKQKSKLVSRLLGKKDDQTNKSQTYPECLESFPGTPLPEPVGIDQPALLLCTSGTTGLPKILQLTLGNLLASTKTTSNQLGFSSDIRMLNLLPLTHYDGVVSGLFTTFYNSATLVRVGPFGVSRLPDIFDSIFQYRATHLLLTPAILGLMLRLGEEIQESFQSKEFQFVISVAATLPPKLCSDFQEITGKRVVNIYGLSETGNNFFAGPDDASYRIGAIGKPVDCQSAIVGEDGQRVSPGETGELLLRGAGIIPGYLDQSIETVKLDGEEWFATGDLAFSDDDGIYWLVGRKKNIIIVGGRNVYPEEINIVLLSHPDVTEAATLGLPDELWGERVISCVVTSGGITSSALLEHAAKNLTDYKVPREIHFFADLPRGRSGKVLLAELAKRLQGSSSSKDAVADLSEKVLLLAAESFRIPRSEVSLKTAPANCSRWDSVAHMDFVTNLESNFGVELLPREIIQITSIDAAVRIVGSKRMTGGETD